MNKGHCDICKEVFDVEGRQFFIICWADQNDTVTVCPECLVEYLCTALDPNDASGGATQSELVEHLSLLDEGLAQELSEVE